MYHMYIDTSTKPNKSEPENKYCLWMSYAQDIQGILQKFIAHTTFVAGGKGLSTICILDPKQKQAVYDNRRDMKFTLPSPSKITSIAIQ